MANLKKSQSETVATIDTAKAMIDKVLTIMDIMVNMPSISRNLSTNPMAFLIQLLEHAGVTYEDLKLWLTDFLIYVTPAMELGVKTVLLTNLKNMVSCSVDPRIPEKYRKRHKAPADRNTPNEYGIDINVESIDYLDKMSVSPLSDFGRQMYFGQNGVDNVYQFARADDFDAFLWFVIHKGKFPSSSLMSTDLHEFNDKIHGSGSFKRYGDSLLDELHLIPEEKSVSSILPGNTFAYKNNIGPNVISMCIDAFRNKDKEIILNVLVPVSDDLTSVNWYTRNKDELGANLFGAYAAATAQTEYIDGKKRTTGVETKNKSRDYSKEKAICNLQYIDQSYGDQEITGLANNKIRFTILPKPLMHIPNLAAGEPPWRFKKMLFDAEANYDPNGKYTINDVADDNNLEYLDGAVKIDPKSGDVTVTDKPKVIKSLVECYPGLTVYEFNYDYVMGMKLFDAKAITTTLLDSLQRLRMGINTSIGYEQQSIAEEVKEIIKNIVESDEISIEDCFFEFSNEKYDALLKNAEEKRARKNDFTNVKEILNELKEDAELHEQVDILNRAITQATLNVIDGVNEEDKISVRFNLVTDLIEQLTLAIVMAILSPKVLMLFEVNETIMGGKWQKITVKDLIKLMKSIIISIIKEVRDLIIQELTKLVSKLLSPIVSVLISSIAREQIENYTEAIDDIIRNCPRIWFKLGTDYSDTKLDTVDYADIIVKETKEGESPKLNNC